MSSKQKQAYHISRNGKTFGPYPEDLLIEYIQDGLVLGSDFIYHCSEKKWVRISSFFEQILAEGSDPDEFITEQEDDPGEVLEKQLREEYNSNPLLRSYQNRYIPGQNSDIKPLSTWLGINPDELIEISKNAETLYKPFPVKREGKKDRWIEAPDERLKCVQRSILDRLLINIPLNGAAHGFVPNRSILTHASQHRRKRWVVTLDIRSFFPSVDSERVREVAEELPIPEEDIEHFINLTVRNNHLPQGAPTSPTLGNLVLRNLDQQLCNLVRGTGWFYTRYADDLTFSGFKKPGKIMSLATRLIQDEGFSISDEKSRIRGKEHRQMVTGIVVNDKLALSRPKRDMVRSMKHRLAKGEVPHHEMNHVLGWINFANHVDRSNQTLPRSGPSVRPGRISFRKICLALDMVKKGKKPEEIIRSLGISRSSYYRAKRSKYISENLRSLYLQQEDIEKACQLIESGEIQEALALVQSKSSKL